MNLLAVDTLSSPLRGSFSVAVTNETDIPFDDVNEHTIESSLLLTSELKGLVETPNYYFTNPDRKKDKFLDNLMLTQGWRNFDWKRVASGALPSLAYEPEKGFNISGKVTELLGRPSAGAKVTLMSSSGDALILDTVTKADGKFTFSNLTFDNTISFIVQAQNAKGKGSVEIAIDSIKPQIKFRNNHPDESVANTNQSISPYLSSRAEQLNEMRKKGLLKRGIELSEVTIVSAKPKPKVKHSSNLNGPGQADAVLLAENLRDCLDWSCLQGKVAGLVIQNNRPSLSRGGSMRLVIDGAYPENFSLRDLPIHNVESIEVLKTIAHTGIYGGLGSGGIMVITTKRGQISPNVIEKGVAFFTREGYNLSRQFYSPKYDSPENQNAADFRSTIYWAPNIITDSDGKASIEFYTADKPGTYKAVIEGIDLNGSIARKVLRFKVN